MIEIKEKHIPELFFKRVAEMGDKPFLARRNKSGWETFSWKEIENRVVNFAFGLMSLGISKEDHVAIFSPNRVEWAISDIAILSAAKADIPIYPTNSAEEAEYILNDSSSVAIVLADETHLKAVLQVKDRCPALKHIIMMDKIADAPEEVLHFDDVIKLGENFDDKEELERRLESTKIDDMATLIYTSGTTGPPKGVILTHKNFLSNVYQAYNTHKEIFKPDKSCLSFLPLSHSMERTGGWYLAIFNGITIYYAQDAKTVVDDMKEVKPNFLISVPRLFEKIYAGIHQKVEGASPLKKKLFSLASNAGLDAIDYLTQHKPMPLFVKLRYMFFKRLVLDKLKVALGAENIEAVISGGGPLSVDVNRFLNCIGFPVHEAYGLTETTPVVAANTPAAFRFGSVGRAVADTEIRIAEDGEILVRGPQVMKGYYNKPEATAEAIDKDGWFYTGDIGKLEDDFLFITDRKKDLIITAGGKNISPQNIENSIVIDPYIETVVVIGDKKPYITALLVPDFEMLQQWAEENGVKYTDNSDLISKPEILKLYEDRIAIYNPQFARVEQIKKFRLLGKEFTQQSNELTPTMKLKRKVVSEKYSEEIESLYK